jgi:hypothetical protein
VTKDQLRDKYLRDTYGISTVIYGYMLAYQRGVCAICFNSPKPGKRFHVDHDHKTGRVRGLLCHWCNRKILGRRRENPDHHERAAAYLRKTFDWRYYSSPATSRKATKTHKAKARAAKV